MREVEISQEVDNFQETSGGMMEVRVAQDQVLGQEKIETG